MRPRPGVFRLLVCLAAACCLLPARGAYAADPRYFPETQHNLADPMLSYWQRHGGLPVFGFPISEAFPERNADTGQTYSTQYLERNRFEAHPENGAPYDVLLGRLGVEVLQRQGRDWNTFPKADPATAHFFGETGHAIGHAPFWQYFSSRGLEFDGRAGKALAESIALFGFPVSEPAMETNSSGDNVLTQWFERARFEDHGGKGVLLGLLGNEVTGERRAEGPFLPVAGPPSPLDGYRQRLFELTNQERAALGKPALEYRSDIQSIVDEASRALTEAGRSGGDRQEVVRRYNERLQGASPPAIIVAGQTGAPLTAQCNGVDPNEPLKSSLSVLVIDSQRRTVTIGIDGPYSSSCGPAISVLYAVGP